MRVVETRLLRKMSGAKRDEITWEWRRLHYKKLYDLYLHQISFK
jgi:hypothetical protein